MRDALGDRMKLYEKMEHGRKLMPRLPILVRLDGKKFTSFTRGLDKPWDEGFRATMLATTITLAKNFNARAAHTYSDEISLLLLCDGQNEEPPFGGKVQKLVSIIASNCTACFNNLTDVFLPEKKDYAAMFDCRVWNTPDKQEAVNTFIWRELDATRNSVHSAAAALYSHKQLMNKNSKQKQEMLHEKGINWNDYPDHFKRGTFIIKRKRYRELSEDERMRIPEDHRPPEEQLFERTAVAEVPMPRLLSITNRVEVLFDGAIPEEA